MTKTIVGLFDSMSDAERTIRELVDNGYPREDISLVANNARNERAVNTDDTASEAAEGAGAGAVGGTVLGGLAGLLIGLGILTVPGIGPVVAAGALATTLGWTAAGAGIGAAAGTLIGGLVGAGIPDEDAQVYAEGIRRGGTLVMLTTNDDRTEQAVAVMHHNNVVDVERRQAEYRESGWTSFDPAAQPYSGPYSSTSVSDYRETAPRGTFRGSYNRPDDLQENWEESSKVGTVGGALAGAATGAALGSTAGPVGTVVGGIAGAATGAGIGAVGDAAGEEVEQSNEVGGYGLERYDADFRNHYQSYYADSGYTYEQFSPVYGYGYTLATTPRYSSQEWDVVEPEARISWEERNPGTWDRFRDSVRYGWDKARNR